MPACDWRFAALLVLTCIKHAALRVAANHHSRLDLT
jgi:hypothetical protein